jgi:uncharacterized membrane protein
MENQEKPNKETLEHWHKDPNNWILGVFYFNKNDKRIFPPKRMKWAGWTVNFGNRASVLVFVAVITFIIIVIMLKS